MPCFHFDLQKGDTINRDDDGAEFPDIAAARLEALMAAREILAEAIKSSSEDVPEYFIITDCDRTVLATIAISEALPMALRPVNRKSF